MTKKHAAVLSCIALAAVIGGSVGFAMHSKSKADETEEREQSSSVEAAPLAKRPIYVENDTDGQRIYGTDVLYCRGGIKITLDGSRDDEIDLTFENDSDKGYTFSTDYVVANGASVDSSIIFLNVEAKTSEQYTLRGLTDQLPDGDVIDQLLLRFEMYDENYEDNHFSEPIKIVYSSTEHSYQPWDYATLVYRSDELDIYCNSVNYRADDPEDDYDSERLLLWIYYINKGERDISLSPKNVYAADGSSPPEEIRAFSYTRVPPQTVATDSLSIESGYSDLSFSLFDTKKIDITLYASYNDGEDDQDIELDTILADLSENGE